MSLPRKHNIREFERQVAQHEPPASSLEGLVEEIRDKPYIRQKYSKRKTRPRHLNESDEKVIKEVAKDAVGRGVRAAEKAMMAHHPNSDILEDLKELGISKDNLHELVELKHNLKRKEYYDQGFTEMTEDEFRPVMIEVMDEETGELLPLFNDRKRLRREKANEDNQDSV